MTDKLQLEPESIFLSEINMSEIYKGKRRYLVVSEELPNGETIKLVFDHKSPQRMKLVKNPDDPQGIIRKDIAGLLPISDERIIMLNIMNDLRSDIKVLLGGVKLSEEEFKRSYKRYLKSIRFTQNVST